MCPDELTEWQAKRHAETVSLLNLPTEKPSGRPFGMAEYPHKRSLRHSEWGPAVLHKFQTEGAENIVPRDISAPSALRPGGYAVWDAAAGIPSCGYRSIPGVARMNEVPTTRRINRHWFDSVLPSFNAAGFVNGMRLRPNHPFRLDLRTLDDGWELMNAAHVMAHLRGDNKTSRRKIHPWQSKTAFHFQSCLAEMAFSELFGLPLRIEALQDGESDFPHGIELKSSSRYTSPHLRVPWCGREAPVPDVQLAFASAGVFIEPHPVRFRDESEVGSLDDIWCSHPTAVTIVGWEAVDVLCHAQIAHSDPKHMKSPAEANYVITAGDLRHPQELRSYIQAHVLRGAPQLTGRVFVRDWMRTPEYAAAFAATPPLPCRECLRINADAPGAPERPEGLPPDKLSDSEAWMVYARDLAMIHRRIDAAVIEYEAAATGNSTLRLKAERRERTAAHRAKMDDIDNALRVASIRAGYRRRGSVTQNDLKFMKARGETL